MNNANNNTYGRAYEHACLIQLAELVAKTHPVEIIRDSHFAATERSWNEIDDELRNKLAKSGKAAAETILALEKLIIADGDDPTILSIQPDSAGMVGDVRDILIRRKDRSWEVGLSIKHNNFAVKHSRLAKTLDFGDKWFGVKCSQEYWNEVAPIFNYLDEEHKKKTEWKNLPNKEMDVYVPLLKAFLVELECAYGCDQTIPQKLVEYLLGRYDFYKVISLDSERLTRIQPVNLHGTLNKPDGSNKPTLVIPVSALPTRIIAAGMRPGSSNTAELFLDKGWQFSFRIHNASTVVESSLKFDIKFEGLPVTIISINTPWEKK